MLGDYRKKRKLTQKELAEKSGVPIRALKDYEQGQRDLYKASAITVYKISKALGVSMEELTEDSVRKGEE